MERPSIRQLECIVAVAEHRSFRRAAAACYITQPALSAQVRQAETLLGVRLFERDRRRVLVTPAGEEVVGRARDALAAVDAVADAARVFVEPLAGTLRLGVIPTVAPYVLPRALPAIRRAHPKLRLLLREDRTANLVDLAKRGELELLLLALEADLGDLVIRPLYADPFVLAAPAWHPLLRRRRLGEEDLAGEDVLLLEDGHCLREQSLSVCRTAGAEEIGDFRASSLNTLVRMVASGVGVTLLPAMSVAAEVHGEDDVAVRPLGKGRASRTIGLAWRASSARAGEFELLAELFRANAPEGVVPLASGKQGSGKRG